MRCGMNKPRSIKVRLYVALLIYLNEYLIFSPGTNLSDKIGKTKLNKLLLNSMPNRWYKKAYVQGFDCEYISLKNLLICLRKWILLNLFM